MTLNASDSIATATPGSNQILTSIRARVDGVDWKKVHAELDLQGWSQVPRLLTLPEADLIAGLYRCEEGFRSRIVMSQHGFGRGEYKYFSYPLPRCP